MYDRVLIPRITFYANIHKFQIILCDGNNIPIPIPFHTSTQNIS